MKMLGVKAETLSSFGAVSAEAAREMAFGALANSDADFAVAVTGIAGPAGGTAEKPVGLVYVGMDCGAGNVTSNEFRFHGDRHLIKQRSSQAALNLLRRWLLNREPSR